MRFLFFLLFYLSFLSFSQELIVYRLNRVEEYNSKKIINFVSISDQYQLSSHPDSSAIPISYLNGNTSSSNGYIKLKGKYRQRCLASLQIMPNDIVYIYDYHKHKLLRFYVRSLNLIAVISPYSHGENYPISQQDYMIGFEIKSTYLKKFDTHFTNTLVSIAQKNPFAIGKIKPIVWNEIDSTFFPKDVKLKFKALQGSKITYQFVTANLTYFGQDLSFNSWGNERHIVIVNSKTNDIIFERMYCASEGTSLEVLNTSNQTLPVQFTGNLFKDKPPVVLGFMYYSFGCPKIDFIVRDYSALYINCDNRH